MTDNVKIEQGNTLWGVAKQQLKEQTGQEKISNQQIVDAMKAIAQKNGYGDDFDACAKDKFYNIGNEIEIPGLCIENGKVGVVPEEAETPPAGASEDDATPTAGHEEIPGSNPAGSAARENTTMGAAGTLLVKGLAKKDQIKTLKPDITRQAKNAKGKVLKAKAQHVRNTAAGKIKAARNAEANLKAEKKKLDELKEKRAAVQKKLSAERKRSYKVDANGKKITYKPRLEARKKAKEARIENANKELKNLDEQINTQKTKVQKATTKKTAAKKSASAAKKKVTKQVTKRAATKTTGKATAKTTAKTAGKAAGKTLLKKIPVLGLAIGVGLAIDRAAHGDYAGAGMEVASGAASTVPGWGTAVSVGIDVALGAKDLHDAGTI